MLIIIHSLQFIFHYRQIKIDFYYRAKDRVTTTNNIIYIYFIPYYIR